MVSSTGGRISVFQASLPNVGPGALASREDPNLRASKDVPNLNPATDFYKKLALDCSGQQVAVDLFLLGGQYMDIASLCKWKDNFPPIIFSHETLCVCYFFQLASRSFLVDACTISRASTTYTIHCKLSAWNVRYGDI